MPENDTPLFGFRFRVAFVKEPIAQRGGGTGEGAEEPLAQGAFAEVTGLEAAMEPKAIREGGMNLGAHQRAGAVSFATVVLKRGITRSRDLWAWWSLFSGTGGTRPDGAFAHRLTVRITVLDIDGTPLMVWKLARAMPIKFKAADLNARAAEVGIEEVHLVHEGLSFEAP